MYSLRSSSMAFDLIFGNSRLPFFTVGVSKARRSTSGSTFATLPAALSTPTFAPTFARDDAAPADCFGDFVDLLLPVFTDVFANLAVLATLADLAGFGSTLDFAGLLRPRCFGGENQVELRSKRLSQASVLRSS